MQIWSVRAAQSTNEYEQRKAKRKKYQSVDQFMRDVETMFENAKMYNRDDSQIYKDAVDLQVSRFPVVFRCRAHQRCVGSTSLGYWRSMKRRNLTAII